MNFARFVQLLFAFSIWDCKDKTLFLSGNINLLFLSFHFYLGLLNLKNLFFFAGANVIPFSFLATFYESFFDYFLF
jgi:hypothetical protein